MPLLDAELLYERHAFENDLPIPPVIDTAQRSNLVLQIRQTEQFLGLYDDQDRPLSTTVWGYGQGNHPSYPGPTIVAYQGLPITVQWQNKLPFDGYFLPVDTSLHLADPQRQALEEGFVPVVTHLHGGHSASAFDGLPEAWFTRSGRGGRQETGPDFVSKVFIYENDQPGATLWYHDHALGLTRLNVYSGLAGFYVLQDETRLGLFEDGVLPGGAYDLGLAIQDRAFTEDGQLYYPAYRDDPLPGSEEGETVGDVVPQAFYDAHGEDAASAVPEFFGDVIVVNGMAWPRLAVAAGEHHFRLLNGSDSRFYVLRLSDPDVAAHLVGVDGGLLPEARTIFDDDGVAEPGEFLVLAPGDRVDLVFDFSGLAPGDTVRLLNEGPEFEPFKGVLADGALAGDADPADADDAVGAILQFEVTGALAPLDVSLADGTPLSAGFQNLARDADENGVADAATWVRRLGLFEGVDEYGRINPLLGTAEAGALHADRDTPDGAFGPLAFDAPITETPQLGATEQWEIFNFTADSHPIHLHLVQYQVVEKRAVAFEDADEDGVPDDVTGDGLITYGYGAPDFSQADIWIGEATPLRPEETGWQDTLHVDPGQMLSLVATFDRPGEYVWHCHILSHEDHEMMRPYIVTDAGGLI